MSSPLHKRSEKIGVRNESARGAQPHPGRSSSHSSLLFTLSSSALYFVAALTVVLIVGCGSEVAPEPAVPTATSVALVAPTATPVAPSAGRSADRAMAPNFSLPSAGGSQVSLSGLLDDHRAVVLVFYRGYF